jgi:pentatricopeptide repeat protein
LQQQQQRVHFGKQVQLPWTVQQQPHQQENEEGPQKIRADHDHSSWPMRVNVDAASLSASSSPPRQDLVFLRKGSKENEHNLNSNCSWLPSPHSEPPLRRMHDNRFLRRRLVHQHKGFCSTTDSSLSSTNGGFLQNWKRLKNQILSTPVGSLEAHDWLQAKSLLESFQTTTSQTMKQTNAQTTTLVLADGFELLDRLEQEVVLLARAATTTATTLKEDAKSGQRQRRGTTRNDVSFPMHIGGLGALMVAWRDFVLAGNNNARQIEKRTQRDDHRDESASSFITTLSPNQICQKVERYMESGLFPPDIMPYNIILHGMASLSSSSSFGNNGDHPIHNHSAAGVDNNSNNGNNYPVATIPNWGDDLFQRLMERSNEKKGYHPDRATIYGIIELWAKSGLPEAPQKAEQYLNLLKDWWGSCQQQQHNPRFCSELQPTANIYCAVMEAHSRSSHDAVALKRIKKLFQEMKSTCGKKNGNGDDQLAVNHYNRTCHALANCRHSDAADVARAILDEMLHDHHNKSSSTSSSSSFVKPNRVTFLAVLSAYGRAGRADEAAALFEYMEQLAAEAADGGKSSDLHPDMKTYSALLWAHARAGNHERAEQVLVRLMQDEKQHSLQTWNALLASWAELGNEHSAKQISMVIKRLAGQENDEALTVPTYNMLLACYARYKTRQGAELAEGLFTWLQKQNNDKLHPNAESFLTMMTAWAGAGNPQQSEYYLSTLCQEVKDGKRSPRELEARHFGVVMEAYANSNAPNATKKAHGVFESMNEWNQYLRPETILYTSLIWAYAKSKTEKDPAQPAERLFHEMQQEYKEGNEFVKPNERTYNGVLYALSRSPDPMAAKRAEEIFAQMKEVGIKPNSNICNTLMSLWAKRNRPDKVEEKFQEMKQNHDGKSHTLDFRSYVTRLQSWSKVGDPEMTTMALKE